MVALQNISLTVNGVSYERDVEARMTLVDFIRQELGLGGTHVGCEHGVCGACTILVNGTSMRSCLLLAVAPTSGTTFRASSSCVSRPRGATTLSQFELARGSVS